MRFRRRRRRPLRHAYVDVDRRRRFVVGATHEIFKAAPAAVLPEDADEATLGEAVQAALAERGEGAGGWAAGLRDHGIKPGELDRNPGVGVASDGRTLNIHGWRPARAGREPAGERKLPASVTPAALGRAVRELLAELGPPAELPQGATGAAFAYKTAWLCVHGGEPRSVADALDLVDLEEATWEEGVAQEEAVFVSPPTGGWVFAVNVDWIEDPDALARLSEQLGSEVQFFGSHRVVDACAWMRAEGGRVLRRFQWVGDQGELVADGEPSEVERRLGLDWVQPEPGEPPDWDHLPDEETVLEIAEDWSINPGTLDLVSAESEIGLLGRRPSG